MSDLLSKYKRQFGLKFSNFGTDGAGHDLKAFGNTTGKYVMWDASADTLIISGTLSYAGAVGMSGPLTIGINGTGYDVKFYGDTAGKYMMWDESADKLLISGSADLGDSCEANAYTVGGVPGVDYGPAAVASITVVKGIVTAVS